MTKRSQKTELEVANERIAMLDAALRNVQRVRHEELARLDALLEQSPLIKSLEHRISDLEDARA